MSRGKLPSNAFEYYFGLGAGRSYQAVGEHFGVTKRAVTKRAAAEKWQDRIAQLEAKAREAGEQKALESLEQMNDRHLKSLRVIQGKALETLRSMSLSGAMDAIRALDLAIKQERTIRGEPGERTAVSVEQIIKREFEEWMDLVDEEVSEREDAHGDEGEAA